MLTRDRVYHMIIKILRSLGKDACFVAKGGPLQDVTSYMKMKPGRQWFGGGRGNASCFFQLDPGCSPNALQFVLGPFP